MDSKPITLRQYAYGHRFSPEHKERRFNSTDGALTVYTKDENLFRCECIEVTIAIVKSPEERLREARRVALLSEPFAGMIAVYEISPPVLTEASAEAVTKRILAIIERVDAEFAKGEGKP